MDFFFTFTFPFSQFLVAAEICVLLSSKHLIMLLKTAFSGLEPGKRSCLRLQLENDS
jgi:hypothetical protein